MGVWWWWGTGDTSTTAFEGRRTDSWRRHPSVRAGWQEEMWLQCRKYSVFGNSYLNGEELSRRFFLWIISTQRNRHRRFGLMPVNSLTLQKDKHPSMPRSVAAYLTLIYLSFLRSPFRGYNVG